LRAVDYKIKSFEKRVVGDKTGGENGKEILSMSLFYIETFYFFYGRQYFIM
jgi:hypothetical protein